MFTGIITGLGSIAVMQRKPDGGARLRIDTPWDCTSIPIGASIACSGICLTLVEASQNQFAVDASDETIVVTTMAHWDVGTQINLERALALGDELGGHIVSGHVDGVAEIVALRDEGDSTRVTLRAPEALAKFIAPKGSVALNGTSLTVNEVNGTDFGINFIPHTKAVTTWGSAAVGDRVNLEIDTLARYVARLQDWS